ncbi:MAG: NAD(+)/NADH kinase [Sulfolobales archaeon]
MGIRVGLIINPDAGKDIRRLISSASYSSNFTKVELGKRVVMGLNASGVDEVIVMHDNYGLGEDVVSMLSPHIPLRLTLIETKGSGTVQDTLVAARKMKELGVKAMVVVGGDGTLRATFKSCGSDTPLVCVAAGTNNVTGAYYDATLAGYAAGLVATGRSGIECLRRAKALEVLINGQLADVAVIDVAFMKTPYIGAKAIFEVSDLVYAVFSKGEPTDIGLASILGFLKPTSFESDEGCLIEFGNEGLEVKAIIMPGEFRTVHIKDYKILNVGDVVPIPPGRYVVALDGERELEVYESDSVSVRVTRNGPLLINVYKVLNSVSGFGLRGGAFGY